MEEVFRLVLKMDFQSGMWSPISLAFIGFAVCVGIIKLILRSGAAQKFLDIPNGRSLHHTPTPRIGGVGVVAGISCAWLAELQGGVWWLMAPLLFLFGISVLDDMRGLPVRVRLLGHVIASGIFLVGLGWGGAHDLLALSAGLLAMVWMINLYNFMDGSNGLAGGMAVSGFLGYAVAAWLSGDWMMAAANMAIVGAAAGFLLFNFPSAKVFLGDAGSIPLGFLVAAMGLWGFRNEYWPIWFPVLVFSPFIVDATVTLIKRTIRGARITDAHREHYYQRMVQMGVSHEKVALVGYGLMTATVCSALAFRSQTHPWLLLLAWTVIYTCLLFWHEAVWKQRAR